MTGPDDLARRREEREQVNVERLTERVQNAHDELIDLEIDMHDANLERQEGIVRGVRGVLRELAEHMRGRIK